MKKTFLILAASAMFAAACDKNAATSSDEKVTNDAIPVSVKVMTGATKALASSDAENTINTLHLFLYRVDSEGKKIFESYYDFSNSKQGGTIYIDPAKEADSYILAAYANQEMSEDSYLEDWSSFSNESMNAFQMFGNTTLSRAELEHTKSIDISLVRQCSKVTVNNIQINWTNSANNFKEFRLKAMYLMDVEGVFKNLHAITGDAANTPWLNMGGHTSSGYDSMLYDAIGGNDGVVVSKDTQYSTRHTFYGYISARTNYTTDKNADWVENGTRLVIEADLDGEACYYSVRINRDSEPLREIRNKHFIIDNITIKTPGSSHPYEGTVDETDISVSVSIADWDEIDKGDIIID